MRRMSRDSRNRNQRQRDRSPSRSYWSSSSSSIELRHPEEPHSQQLSEDIARAVELLTTTPDLFGCKQCIEANLKGLEQEPEISLLQWQRHG
jgi:hypothetical protein